MMKKILTLMFIFGFMGYAEAKHNLIFLNADFITQGQMSPERVDPSSFTLGGPIVVPLSALLDNTASTQTKSGTILIHGQFTVGNSTYSRLAPVLFGSGQEGDFGNRTTLKLLPSTGTDTSSLMLDGVTLGIGGPAIRNSATWLLNNASTFTVLTGCPDNCQQRIRVTTGTNILGDLVVSGNFSAPVKNFRIPHPTDINRWLEHSVVESDRYGLTYDGESQLSGGAVTINLPSYFELVCDDDDRTVQLTSIDGFSPLYVDGPIVDGKLKVKTAAGGNSSQKFYWKINGKRGDPYVKSIGELVVEPLISESEIDIDAESNKSGFKRSDVDNKVNATKRMRSKYYGYESEMDSIKVREK